MIKSFVMDDNAIARALKRISFEIEEKNKGFDDVILIGILSRGLPLARRIAAFVEQNENIKLPIYTLDIRPHRDDNKYENAVDNTDIDIDLSDKVCILVDDVMYTGRTARAAIDALFEFGRPKCIQLAVLVDRGHRELPIRPDYVGKNIPTSLNEKVSVKVPELDGESQVTIENG